MQKQQSSFTHYGFFQPKPYMCCHLSFSLSLLHVHPSICPSVYQASVNSPTVLTPFNQKWFLPHAVCFVLFFFNPSINPLAYQLSFNSLRVTCLTRSGFYPMWFCLFFCWLGSAPFVVIIIRQHHSTYPSVCVCVHQFICLRYMFSQSLGDACVFFDAFFFEEQCDLTTSLI
jgi:hypothetical protein